MNRTSLFVLALFALGLLLSQGRSGHADTRPQVAAPNLVRGAACEAADAADAAEGPADIEQLQAELSFGVEHISMTAEELVITGWGSWSDAMMWCEIDAMHPCSTDEDCSERQTCVHPWWAQDKDERVCAEKWPGKDTRQWRRDRMRTIVDMTCQRSRGCDARQLHAFLSVVALRESTWRPQKRHRLNPDIESAMRAWRRRADVFADNWHYHESSRWSTGLGLYGMNPAIFVDAWDPAAPPEVLCREVEATAAYLERARRAVRGFRRRGIAPTLCDVHHAVSGGKLERCGPDSRFRARAARAALDVDVQVTEASFGQAPPGELPAKLAWAEALHSVVEAKHPRPR